MGNILMTGDGKLSIDKFEENMKFLYDRKLLAEERERQLAPYRLRAEALGITLEEAANMAILYGISVEDYLVSLDSLVNCLIDYQTPKLFSLSDFVESYEEAYEEEGYSLSAAEIRKQLKYEKNPMRIKQLNKMLYGVSKKVKKKM